MIIGGIVLAIALFVGIFVYLIPSLQKSDADEPSTEITLTAWGVDDPKNFGDLLSQYGEAHPNITINYRQVPEDRYEATLLNAMATDQAPDILMVHRSWVYRYGDKILAADPARIQASELATLFPDVVSRDFIYSDYVFALPLYIDTPALLYNKDLFNAKGVATSPKTWGDIKLLVPYFTEFTASRQLKKSAIALGGSSRSIANAPDILSLFIFQHGARQLESMGAPTYFDDHAIDAAEFYTQFSTPNSPYYTWSDALGNAGNLFGSGDVAMTLSYARDIPTLRQKNPYLNFGVIPMPQQDTSNPVNYADYWGLAVSSKSPNTQWAWKFVTEATTDPMLASIYMKSSGNPPALRELINSSLRDPQFGVFARQALTARAPYQFDAVEYRTALSRSIESLLAGQFDAKDALQKASTEINASQQLP